MSQEGPRRLEQVYADAYRAYLRTLREGMANVDIEAVEVSRPAAGLTRAPTLYTFYTYQTYNTFYTYHTWGTWGTTGTTGTIGTVATEQSIQ